MPSQTLCAALFSSGSRFALVVTDPAGLLISFNRVAGKLLGIHEGLVGTDMACIFTRCQRQAGHPHKEMQDALSSTATTETRLYRHLLTGHEIWVEGELSSLFDDAGVHIGFVRFAHDVNERYLNDGAMRREAGIDQLTGLLNRRAFHEKLDHHVAGNTRANSLVILHLVDLDFFKQVNDSLGHEAGDVVLKEIATRLKSVTREADQVGRLGGDEFAVLQTGASSLIDGSFLATKLVEVCRQPIRLPDHEVAISASIGIATAPGDSSTVKELLRKADLALYRVKSIGRNNYCYFTQELDEQAKRHTMRMAALRDAMQSKQFHLEYQPIMSMHDGSVSRAEALLRCDHSALKSVPIDQVLALLRHSGDMFQLSQWIIDQACRDLNHWLTQGHDALQVSINLCARELSSPDIVPIIESALWNHGLDANSLSVELTEHDILDNKQEAIKVINALRSMGITISLDDFGTGFASMEYLTTLPIDILKVDRTFVEELPHDPISTKIVDAMIGLAHALGIRVVAEGVELPCQRDYLARQTCDEVQGYLISAPLDEARFSRFRTQLAPG